MTETVAFLFADLVDSTRLLSQFGPDTYARVLRSYRQVVEDAIAAEGGEVVDREGDGLFLVVPSPAGALRAAATAQRRIAGASWSEGADITVRMGIHVGEAHPHADGYVGLDVNRAARIGALAHGGQVLVSEATRALALEELDPELGLRDLDEHELKGFEHPERVHQLLAPGLRDPFPPLRSGTRDPAAQLRANRSVAVLPFQVIGDVDHTGSLAVGLHTDLISELSRNPELTVISRSSVLGFQDSEAPATEVARQLNAGSVVEGTIQTSGHRVRMTVELIDGIDGAQRWSQRYDRELTTRDLFELQSDLADQIVDSLAAELVPDGRDRGPGTADLEAYRLVSEGRRRFDLMADEVGFRSAIELFERAIERDPDYPDAWIGLAEALALMRDFGFGDRTRLLPRAEEAVRRVLELAPASPGAHTAAGLLHLTNQEAETALDRYRHAVRLQPSYAHAHAWISWITQLIGRTRTALTHALRAVELNPLSSHSLGNLSMSYLINGQPDRALEEILRCRSLAESTTDELYEGIILYETGRYEEARDVLEPLAARSAGGPTVPWAGHGPDATLALTFAALGEADAARAVLASIDPSTHPFATGLVLLGLGDVDDATGSLSRVDHISAWPALAIHHLHRDVWEAIRGTDTHRDLVRTAYRSWGIEPT